MATIVDSSILLEGSGATASWDSSWLLQPLNDKVSYQRVVWMGTKYVKLPRVGAVITLSGIVGATSVYLWEVREAQDETTNLQTLVRLNGITFGLGLVSLCTSIPDVKYSVQTSLTKLGVDTVHISNSQKGELDRAARRRPHGALCTDAILHSVRNVRFVRDLLN